MNLFIEELKKVIRLFIADPKPLAAGLIAPTMILIIFSIIFGSFAPLPVSVINYDSGEYGERLKNEIFNQISPLGGKTYFNKVELTEDQAVTAFNNSKLVGVVIIPEIFSKSIEEETFPEIEFYLDNLNSDLAKNLRLYLYEGIISFYRNYYPEMAVIYEEALPAEGQVEWVEIIATGSILLSAIIGGMFLYLYLFFKEKEYGTILFYRLSPVSPGMSFLARITASWGFSMLTALINMTLAFMIVGRNFFLSLEVLIPVLSLVSISYIGIAAILSLFTDKFYAAAMASMFGSILGWFICGGMSTMPIGIDSINSFIARLLPNIYALRIIRNITLGLNVENLMFNYGILIIMMVVFIFSAYLFLYRKLYRNCRN